MLRSVRPVCIVSAVASTAFALLVLAAGFRGHVVKPADAATIARALLDALQERRAGPRTPLAVDTRGLP
jgi:ActR/RegA family two-component response regulator